MPHVIIEQHHVHGLIAVLLTSVHTAYLPHLVRTAAFSVSDMCPPDMYSQLMSLTQVNEERFLVLATHEGRPIRPHEVQRRPTGHSIIVTVYPRVSNPAAAAAPADATSMMQLGHPSVGTGEGQFWIGPDTGSTGFQRTCGVSWYGCSAGHRKSADNPNAADR